MRFFQTARLSDNVVGRTTRLVFNGKDGPICDACGYHSVIHPFGKATLTFQGFETFVGEAITEGDVTWLQIERALPEHPLIRNPMETIHPSPKVRSTLMGRLQEEAGRRGQSIPAVPKNAPAPTRLAKLRRARVVSRHAPTQSKHAQQTVTVTPERI